MSNGHAHTYSKAASTVCARTKPNAGAHTQSHTNKHNHSHIHTQSHMHTLHPNILLREKTTVKYLSEILLYFQMQDQVSQIKHACVCFLCVISYFYIIDIQYINASIHTKYKNMWDLIYNHIYIDFLNLSEIY